MSQSILSNYSKYNYWANERIISLVEKVGESSSEKNIISSFPSIHKTLLHILDAQYLWLYRMQNDHFPEAPSESFSGNLEELISLVLKSSEELMNYVNAIKENELERTLTYKNSKGIQFTSSYSETILHCINHSTYHRGQIITMLRQLGQNNLLSTDYITYCRGINPFK